MKKKKKTNSIFFRFNSDIDIEILNRAKSKIKEGEYNKKLGKILIEGLKTKYINDDLIENHSIAKDLILDIMDSTIIPRFYAIVSAMENNLINEIKLINSKTNFLINEFGNREMVDGRPIIIDINEKTEEKNWMNSIKNKIHEESYIKKAKKIKRKK